MKRRILIFGFLSFITLAFAKKIKEVEAGVEDYISLLNASGYEAYCFDISDLKDSTYEITIELKEYSGGCDTVVSSKTLTVMNNRRMVEDFMWRELDKEEFEDIRQNSIDFENGVYKRADKVTIGFLPLVNDSTERYLIEVENLGKIVGNLSLKPITDDEGDISFLYASKPFHVSSFQEGEFIPMVLYGSYWFDGKYHVIRFCGESQLTADMSSEMLQSIPHYYIIGVTINPKN